MIYQTKFDPVTRWPTAASVDSGLETLDDVELFYGPGLTRGKRWVCYEDVYFSEYLVSYEPRTKNQER